MNKMIEISFDEEGDTPDLGAEAFIDIEDSPAEEEEDTFGIPGEETTGRKKAEQFIDKVEGQIQSEYESLGSDQDREEFYDYLLTNIKLHMDGFEDELAIDVEEPTTPEYEKAAADADEPAAEEEETLDIEI